jgi:hypothetical protein
MRRSSRGKRNEQDFQTTKAHLDKLRESCGAVDRDFDLIYSAYQSFKDLSEAFGEILRVVGSKYRLSFAH